MKILIAEDELDMQRIMKIYLERAGYAVDVVNNGEEAFESICNKNYDLLVCDWMMPKINGIDLCKEVRSYGIPIKIIMLTAKSRSDDEIVGLSCGADDYIKKPFEPQILLLRIEKILNLDKVLTCGDITLNPKNQMVFVAENEVKLTQKEFMLLKMFMINKGVTLSRELILDRVWGNNYLGYERTIDTHIRRLRLKIGKEYITTYVGVGYRMENINE